MKGLLNRGLALGLAFCLALPWGSVGSLTALADDDQDQENNTVTEQSMSEEESADNITSLAIEDDLHNQYGAVLYEEGLLSSENNAASFTYDQNSDSVVISGKKTDLVNSRILIDKEYDFSDTVLGRFSMEMSAPKKTIITVGFYLDDDTEPFFTTNLARQKKDDTWEYSQDASCDIYDLKITGTHKVSFAVLDNEKTPEDVSFSFKSFEFVKSSVPVVYFDIDEELGTIQAMNGDTSHSTECYGDMSIRIPEGYESEYGNVKSGKYTYALDYIRGRGNSTWTKSKKPYKIKLAEKANLLGMGKQKHWVLLANYFDNSLLRNKITYWLGEQINEKIAGVYEFTPASVTVDVVMNGEYYGSYFLCEQIRVGDNRVEIDDLEETPDATDAQTISGGYLLSINSYLQNNDDDAITFTTKKAYQDFKLESPAFITGNVNQTQLDYIENYVQDVEDAIYGKEFKNSDGVYYGDLMDITSTAYYYLMQEISMNGDGFGTDSTMLYKTRDVYDEDGNLTQSGKLFWGPLWDFDYVAWGSNEYSELVTDGWNHSTVMWFSRLFESPEFAREVLDAWTVLKEQLEELIADGGQMDQYYEQIKDSADYNFEHLGSSPIANDGEVFDDEESSTEVDLTYEEEITRLKTWIRNRIDWIDANIENLAPSECEVTYDLGGETITKAELQGHTVSSFPTAPDKKGYTFMNWEISYHMTYEEYLDYCYATEEELIEENGKAYVEELKTKGCDITEIFDKTSSLPMLSAVTIKPYYVKTSTLKLPDQLYMGAPSYLLCEGDLSFDIPLGCSPFNASLSGVKWTTSDPSVATVDDGTLEIVSGGTVTITASLGSLKASCKVRILSQEEINQLDNGTRPDSAKLNYSSVTMNLGTFKHFYLKYYPSGTGTTDTPTFTSTDKSVVRVGTAGVVKAVGTGTCSIVSVYDDQILTCKVTVVDPDKVVTGTAFSANGLKYKVTSVSPRTVQAVGAVKQTITKLKVPSTVKYKGKTYKVTSIGSKAFSKYAKLKNVTLGANVKEICNNAFYGCKKLYSVTTNKKLVYIGSKAFGTCPALRKVYIKASSMKIFTSSFSGIKSAARVYVPKKVTGYFKSFIKKTCVVGKY